MSNDMTTQAANESNNSAHTLLSAMWRGKNVHQLSYKNAKGYFTPVIVSSISEAMELSEKLNAEGNDVYFACSEFATPENRKAINSLGAWGFWLDIDCGEAKSARGEGYATKKEAFSALKAFLNNTNITQPSFMVDSGNGLHVYFSSDKFIPQSEWKAGAKKLKALTEKHGLLADPTRTDDISSILRVPDTSNHKDKDNLKAVKLKYSKPELTSDILGAIELAYNAENPKANSNNLKLGNVLSENHTRNIEPYPFTNENAIRFLNAAKIAYPNIIDEGEFTEWGFTCANLIAMEGWPESEVKRIFDEVCHLTPDAKTDKNDEKWKSYKEQSINYKGTPIRTCSLFLKARKKGWVDVTVNDALSAAQNKFALISLGGKVGIIDKQALEVTNSDGTAARLVVMSRADGGLLLQRFLAKEYPQVDSGKMLSDFTRSKETTLFNGVEFNPRSTSPDVLNLWVGATVIPKQGNCPFIHKLLHEVLCGGRQSEYQYLIKYLAHALQRPWEKPGVMVVLLGGQGIGKGTLAKILQKMWSATFLQTNRIKEVVGDFNGSLERSYIVFLDEALFVGDRNSSDALKSLVTEPSISINEKHQPNRQIKSYHRFFSATNADHFKATDRDDRRDFVLRVSEHRKGDHAFWDALNAEIENGGVEALTHELLETDLTAFNIRAKPNTRELTEQKLQSLDKFSRWWFDCLSQGLIVKFGCTEWPSFISSESLRNSYLEAERLVRSYKSLIDRDVVTVMSKVCKSAKREQGKEGVHRKRGFTLPSLDIARLDFEKFIGDKIEWEDM